jgi:hypothetical protein
VTAAQPGAGVRLARAVVRAGRRIPGLRALLLARPVASAGCAVATGCALAWGAPLSRFRVRRSHGLLVCAPMPTWSFGRGGTTVGAVYLTRTATGNRVLEHEAVHSEQWRRYGLVLPVLYLAAGTDASGNRFEIEAGLEAGGYL